MIHSFQYLAHGLSRRSSSILDGRCGWNEHALITKCVRASAASGDVSLSRPFRNVPSEALTGASGVGGRPASVVVQGSGTAARCLRLPDVWPVRSPGDQKMGCRQVEFVAGCLRIVGDSRQVPEGGRHRVHIAVGRASADLMLRKCLRSVRANLAPAVSKTRLRGSRSLAILRRCPRPALISPDRLSQVAPASSGVISPTSCCDVATRRSWCSTTSSLGVRLISTS